MSAAGSSDRHGVARGATDSVTPRATPFGACPGDAIGELFIECHGVVVQVRCGHHAFLDLVRGQLPPGSRETARQVPHVSYTARARSTLAGDSFVDVVAHHAAAEDGEKVADGEPLETAAFFLSRDLEFQVALHAPADLFIHAAAVAWRGRVIVLPGQTHSGKSTLTAALLGAGAEYLSDEFAVLAEDGQVRPFHRPIHIRYGDEVHKVPAASLGRMVVEPLPLGAVVRSRFVPGAPWQCEAMTPGETALVLLDNAVAARVRPAHVVAGIGRALGAGTVGLRCLRGEAEPAARAMLASVERAWSAVPTR